MNTYISLARLERALENTAAACENYEKLFAIADHLAAFANHPVVQSWRQEYAEVCGSEQEQTK